MKRVKKSIFAVLTAALTVVMATMSVLAGDEQGGPPPAGASTSVSA